MGGAPLACCQILNFESYQNFWGKYFGTAKVDL